MYTRSGFVTNTHHEPWGLSVGIAYSPESEEEEEEIDVDLFGVFYTIDGSGLSWGEPLNTTLVKTTAAPMSDPDSLFPVPAFGSEDVQGVKIGAWARLISETQAEICIDIRFAEPVDLEPPEDLVVVDVGENVSEPVMITLDSMPISAFPKDHAVEVGVCDRLVGLTAGTDYEVLVNMLRVEREALQDHQVLRWRFKVGSAVLSASDLFWGDYNDDGTVDTADISTLAGYMGTAAEEMDMTGDGTVDLWDLEVLVTQLGYRMGDTNFDGWVDQLDLDALALHWLDSATWETGDFDGDGLATEVDLCYLSRNWDDEPVDWNGYLIGAEPDEDDMRED